MRKYDHVVASYVPGFGIVAVAIATPHVAGFALGNLLAQAVLFTVVAAVPAYRTGRMSYVDIAWPWGLVAIGLQIPVYASDYGPAAVVLTAAYLAIGLRMGLPGAVYLARHGRLKGEFASGAEGAEIGIHRHAPGGRGQSAATGEWRRVRVRCCPPMARERRLRRLD